MKKQFVLALAAFVFLLLVPGCPGGANPLVGTWRLTAGMIMGLELKSNGEAELFVLPPGSTTLAGTFTWEVRGDQFLMFQDTGTQRVIFSAATGSGTSLSGVAAVWEGIGFGGSYTWTALKL